jgi:hypothetical protein
MDESLDLCGFGFDKREFRFSGYLGKEIEHPVWDDQLSYIYRYTLHTC